MKPEILNELFNKAQECELGLIIVLEDPATREAMRMKLHIHRREAGLWPDLHVLLPSDPKLIMLVHKSVELDP